MAVYNRYFQIFAKNCQKNLSEHLRFLNYAVRNESCKRFSRRSLAVVDINHKFHTSDQVLKRRKTAEERKEGVIKGLMPKPKTELVDVWPKITASELAEVLNTDVEYVYDIFLGSINHPYEIISDMKELKLALQRGGRRMRIIGKPVDKMKEIEDKDVYPRPPAPKSALKPRPPIVTVMGHVDHGKTTLLDALRRSNVVDQEFGGITQHVGAFSVELSGSTITFLDTPGHAAFTSMRARGANVTDIVVLVVAADDGVMEQTIESIRMARQAHVPILVAINKIDSPNADVDRAEQMLIQAGIQVEGLGGNVQAVPISALKRINLDKLVEALVLQAEIMEIGADPTGPVEAVVIDSKIHPHRGRLCTIIVQRGTLKCGDILVADTCFAKVRALRDASGNVLEQVPPGFPAEIDGWRDLPSAGELVLEVESEKQAKVVIRVREEKKEIKKAEEDLKAIKEKEEQHLREYKQKLEQRRRIGRIKPLKEVGPRKPEIPLDEGPPSISVIVKGDVDGTVEAILETLDTYESNDVRMSIVHFDVGAVTENDVELAEAFKGIIYAFNVDVPPKIQQLADAAGVNIKQHNVIYKLIDDIKEEISSRLPSKEVEEVLGEAVVLQQFLINEKRKQVPVAGCRCVKGFLKKSAKYRVLRNGKIVYEGVLASMRHLKEEVDSIKNDMECGLLFYDKTVAFEREDTIICYETRMETQKTDWDPGF